MLAHTRWASIGIISEANAHPLNQEELDGDGRADGRVRHGRAQRRRRQLRRPQGARRPALPARDHDRRQGHPRARRAPARRRASTWSRRSARPSRRSKVRSRSRAQSAADPDRVLLAQRGSGQALYVGLAPGAFVVASEPYGLVAECDSYVRLDGETMLDPGQPREPGPGRRARPQPRRNARRHPPAVVRRARASAVDARRCTPPQITTRDVDRGDAPHYLLKEITEAPASFRKTLRGKIVERDGLLDVRLPAETLPAEVLERAAFGRDPAGARDRPGHRRDRGAEPRACAARRDRRAARSRSRR